jgi:hypothetical protein
MATLYEYYNSGDDSNIGFYGAYWFAQTFTPEEAHKITSVKLKLFRLGSPGTITVSIRATDGSGHPTGWDLCSGTIDGNTLTTSAIGAWYEITLGDGYDLAASTKYAIIVRATSGNGSNKLYWRYDGSSPTYTGGNYEVYIGGWSGDTAKDLMFEDWGEAGVTEKTSSDTGSGAEASTQTAALTEAETGSGVEALLARALALTETGAGVDVVAQAKAILGGAEAGSGADAYVSLEKTEAKTSSDAGSGVEATPLPTAVLSGSESGSGIDAIIARSLASSDAGDGEEAAQLVGLLKELFATELGQGIDALVVKRGVFAGGEGTKFFGGGHKPPHRAS